MVADATVPRAERGGACAIVASEPGLPETATKPGAPLSPGTPQKRNISHSGDAGKAATDKRQHAIQPKPKDRRRSPPHTSGTPRVLNLSAWRPLTRSSRPSTAGLRLRSLLASRTAVPSAGGRHRGWVRTAVASSNGWVGDVSVGSGWSRYLSRCRRWRSSPCSRRGRRWRRRCPA